MDKNVLLKPSSVFTFGPYFPWGPSSPGGPGGPWEETTNYNKVFLLWKQCVYLESAVASLNLYCILCKGKIGLYFLLNCMSSIYLFGLLILCLASISLCYAKLWTAGISKTFENAHECSQSSHASRSFSFAGSILLNSHNDTHNTLYSGQVKCV